MATVADHRQVESHHEGAVQLDGVDGQPVEVGQRGVARTEVVDGDLDPCSLRASRISMHPFMSSISTVSVSSRVSSAASTENTSSSWATSSGKLAESWKPEIDDTGTLTPSCRCHSHLGQCGGKHPASDFPDEPHLFGQRNELRRRHMAEHGIVPAYQGLETDDPTLRHIHLGLIAQAELSPTDGLGQELLQGQLAMQALLHAGGEALPAKPPHLLGLVHGHVGTGDEVVAIIGVVG
jgi:hypothetical protein